MSVHDEYIKEDSMSDLWNVWYSELHQGKSGLTFKVNRLIESTESEFQRIDIIETAEFGKALVLYGSLMVAEGDTGAYNEMISHVPLFSHPKPEEVLVIGGGDGGCITNILKHPEVKRATACEIDGKVIEVCKKHFPEMTKGYSDSRCRIKICDGKKFIEETDEKFDVIILDLSDPIGPAADLFQKSFHQDVHNRLNNDGIMVAQSESPLFNPNTIKKMYANLKEIFPIVKMYTCLMPIYPSSYWSFAFCSKKYDPVKDFNKARYDATDLSDCTYYNDEIHAGSFALPNYARKLIK
ncbi:MAG: polyamine aminopropyltransferase [candidate division Zixibacteria bacterium]|nr:polyamine aminopropyltransferase [candidate division Zixibacteria bacterium]